MKTIFLDFDGVIRIPVFTGGPKPEAEYCLERKERVADLAERHHADVVISSDWRLRKSREEIVRVIGPIAKHLHQDWRTVDLSDGEQEELRGLEIQAWLNDHIPFPKGRPGLDNRHLQFLRRSLGSESRLWSVGLILVQPCSR